MHFPKDSIFSITGFADYGERHVIQRLCESLGIGFTASFSRKNTHLICDVDNPKTIASAKYQKAEEWKTKILDSKAVYNAYESWCGRQKSFSKKRTENVEYPTDAFESEQTKEDDGSGATDLIKDLISNTTKRGGMVRREKKLRREVSSQSATQESPLVHQRN